MTSRHQAEIDRAPALPFALAAAFAPALLSQAGLAPIVVASAVMVAPWPRPTPRDEGEWTWSRAEGAVLELTAAITLGTLLAPLGDVAVWAGAAAWLLLARASLRRQYALGVSVVAAIVLWAVALAQAEVLGAPWTLLHPAWSGWSWLGPAMTLGLLSRARSPGTSAPAVASSLAGLIGLSVAVALSGEALPTPSLIAALAAASIGAAVPSARAQTSDAWLLRGAGAAALALVGALAPIAGTWWLMVGVPLFFLLCNARGQGAAWDRALAAAPWALALLLSRPPVPAEVAGAAFAALILTTLAWTAGLWTLRAPQEVR